MELTGETLVYVCTQCNETFRNKNVAVQHVSVCNNHNDADDSINSYFNSFHKISTCVINADKPGSEDCASSIATIVDNSESEHDDVEKNWTNEMTVRLINKIKKFDLDFDKSPMKKFVWLKLTTEFNQENKKNLTPTQIQNKWKTLKRTYKNVLKHNNTSGKNRKQWPYYNLVHEILFKKPEIVAPATCSSNSGLIVRNILSDNEIQPSAEESGEEVEAPITEMQHLQNKTTKSLFIRKRKNKENAAERRHKEKMQRLDQFNDLFAKLVDKL